MLEGWDSVVRPVLSVHSRYMAILQKFFWKCEINSLNHICILTRFKQERSVLYASSQMNMVLGKC